MAPKREYIWLFVGALLSMHPWIGTAQSLARIDIRSNDMDAAVYADSLYLGLVRGGPYWIDHAASKISLVTSRSAAWSILPIQTSFSAIPGDSVIVTLNFPMYHRIESHPYGAKAWIQKGEERRLLGLTPIVFTTSSEAPFGFFHIEMEGYSPAVLTPKTQLWNQYNVTLSALTQQTKQSGETGSVKKHQRKWIDWSAAAVAVAAGVVAVHYKFRADQINDEYLATGDPSLRPRVARLDDYSGIALGVMQAGFITLAVRFALK